MRSIINGSDFWINKRYKKWSTDKTKPLTTSELVHMASVQRAISNFIRIVTGRSVPVEFATDNQSYTDGRTVTLGRDIRDQNFNVAVGLALHEGSHIVYTDFGILTDFNSAESSFYKNITARGCNPNINISSAELYIIKDLLNWIEDRRIDNLVYESAPGYRVYYEDMYNEYFNAPIIDKAIEAREMTKERWSDYIFHITNFTNPKRDLTQLSALRAIWDEIDLQNISRLENTYDSLDVACEVFKLIKRMATDKPETNSSGQVQRRKTVGNLTPSELKKLAEQLRKQFNTIRGKIRKENLKDEEASLIRNFSESGAKGVTIKLPGAAKNISTDVLVIDKVNHNIIQHFCERSDHNATQAVTEGIILGRQLGQKLQIRNEIRSLKTTRLETGKIDKRLLSTAGYGNDKLFHQIVTDVYKEFLIHISIDASGSMDGKNFFNAIKSSVAIAQAASMTKGIRVQITLRGTGHGDIGKSICMYAYDSAFNNMSHIKTLFPSLSTFGGTPEGLAFQSIMKKLETDIGNTEAIFINYSDGMPSNSNSNVDPIEYTRKAVNQIRTLGYSVISYFLEDSGWSSMDKFRRMYGKDAEEIDPTRLPEIAKSLNRKFLQLAEK